MIAIDQMTDEDFERHTLGILKRELGLVGFARFPGLNRAGKGDYTRDRGEWLRDMTNEGILAAIEQQRKSGD